MLIALAIVFGVVIGLLGGGRLANLTEPTFRRTPLLVAGVGLQVLSAFFDSAAVPLILVSYTLLLLFAGANVHHVGMLVVAVGLACNFAVIAANGGMPVRGEAITAAGDVEDHELQGLEFDNKHHLERPDDRLTLLGDIFPVPVPGFRQVVSFGDLVMAIGMADVIVHWLRRRPHRGTSPCTTEAAGTS
ncbi:MAG: DUF5317 domain-containing protein [Actinobacteria bacterium]|nr:DUF5317 domain-containing protein [Actinomycetota bacterium]MBW3649987.1 DUF5317 domain-containing protein [Actinomycetota bacterium]